MSKIFISYSRRDADFALGLQQRLHGQQCHVWLDVDKLQAGQQWREEIVHAIDGCDYFVIVLSSSSVCSQNVTKELSLADSSCKRIIPLMIGQVPIPDAMKYQLADIQFVSLNSGDVDLAVKLLLEALALGSATVGPSSSPSPEVAELASTLSESRLWDKELLLNQLQLAIGPIAHLWLETMPDPLHGLHRRQLSSLFMHHKLDGALLSSALASAELRSDWRGDPSLVDWIRLQVGPIADFVWNHALEDAFRYSPEKARQILSDFGIDSNVVQELLDRSSLWLYVCPCSPPLTGQHIQPTG